MTISTSVGTRPTIEDICYQAMVGAGLRSTSQGRSDAQWRDDFNFAKQRLDLVVGALPMDETARAISVEDVTCVDGQQSYSLSSTVLDVNGDGMYTEPGETPGAASGATLVKQITFEEWHKLSEKSTSGQPTLMWVDRSLDTIVVNFWQAPSKAGNVRLHIQRKLADTKDGSATLDLDEFWDLAIVKSLEAELMTAKTLPLSAIQARQREAAILVERAVSKANPRVSHDAHIRHATPWNRGGFH